MTQITALYRLMLRQQLTTGRLLLGGGFGLLFMLVSFAIFRADLSTVERLEAPVGVAAVLGIGLMIPIVSLVLAASSLGDLVDDETLVYLWHRPIPRWMLAVSAWAASATIIAPLTIVSIVAGTALSSRGNATTIGAIALGASIAVIGYSGLFVLLGLIVRRALIWGLLYIFIWEQFVARVGGGAAKLSILNYPMSAISRIVEISIDRADRPMFAAIVVPILVGLVAVFLAGRRLDRMDVA